MPCAHNPGLVAIAVLMAFLPGCATKPGKVEATGPPAEQIPVAVVVKAAREDLSSGMVLTAEFKPFQEVDLMAKVAGYVKTITVDVGDRVKEGQLLATLEIPEMADDRARAQAALDRSQAEVERARGELRRAEAAETIAHLTFSRLAAVSTQRPGLVAQQEIDDAQSKDLAAQAQVAAAKSSLNAAEQQVMVSTAELQKVKTLFEYTRVIAPFAGVITRRYADTGSMLQAGTSSSTQALPLVKLSENSLLRLILPVPESAVPSVHIGQPVNVKVPTLHRSFPGRVARFDSKVSPATRTMDAEVDVPNPGLILIPGMYAEVNLTLESRRAALTVPVGAVDPGDTESSGQVAVVTADNRVELRPVKLGIENPDRVEIQSGLREGERVIVSSRAGLRSGQSVTPKP